MTKKAFHSKYGPYALVAGASEGLGAAFAEVLAQRGFNLLLVARREKKLATFSEHLENKYDVHCQYKALDLSKYAEVKEWISSLEFDIGLMIYNAAYAPIDYFINVPEDKLKQIIQVNVQTPLLLCKLFSEKMQLRQRSGIVLMSSLAGYQGSPKIATYAASKAFNTILAEGLWMELQQQGIDVMASCAGAIRTPGYNVAEDGNEAPGTMDAITVATNSLDALGKGPTIVPGYSNKFFSFIMARLLPRKLAISLMAKNTKTLSS